VRRRCGSPPAKTCGLRTAPLAMGSRVIKCQSPLNLLKYTYDHLAVIEHVETNTST
jgi:hypothetical protein